MKPRILAQNGLHPQLAESVIDHRSAGEDVVLDPRTVVVTGAEQQFESGEILVAIEDGLTPEKQLPG